MAHARSAGAVALAAAVAAASAAAGDPDLRRRRARPLPGLYRQFDGRLEDSWFGLLFGLSAFVFSVWGFIEMYCLRGSRNTNRFGPDPLAPRDTRPRLEQQSEIEMVPHKAGPPPVWRVKPGYE